MLEPNELAVVNKLQQENAELKLRVKWLELQVQHMNASDAKEQSRLYSLIRMLEMSQEWRAIQPTKIL